MPARPSTLLLIVTCLLSTGCASFSPEGPSPSVEQKSPSSPSSPSVTPPDFDRHELERALHQAVNRARTRRDHAPLVWSDSLRRLARSHSRDMARRNFFGHHTPEGTGPSKRAAQFGFPTFRSVGHGRRIGIGENLFRTYRYEEYRDVYRQRGDGSRRHVRREYDWKSVQDLARETVEGWLKSPPHRRTLLSPDYARHGLGVAFTEKRVYVTQNLF